MILTDAQIHNMDTAPHIMSDAHRIEFARAIERAVLRKLREAGPVAWLYTSPVFKAQQVFIDEPPTAIRGQCQQLFTIPEEQT